MAQSCDRGPTPSADVRNAVTTALEAIAGYHDDVTAASDKAVAKIADAARALGWPEHGKRSLIPVLRGVSEARRYRHVPSSGSRSFAK